MILRIFKGVGNLHGCVIGMDTSNVDTIFIAGEIKKWKGKNDKIYNHSGATFLPTNARAPHSWSKPSKPAKPCPKYAK
jgi:hypothetical protein